MKKKFKRSDLRTGMQVELRDGDRRVVLLHTKNGDMLCSLDSKKHGSLWGRNDDLTFPCSPDLDIVAVYECDLSSQYISGRMGEHHCIWRRKEEEPLFELDGVEYSESTVRSMLKKLLNDA